MSYELNLDAIDVDGAISEAREEAAGDTRLSFLRKGAMTGGAALSGGAILGALVPDMALASSGRPPATFGKGDIGILNYALTLEYLEAAFYNEANAGGAVTDPRLNRLLHTVVKDENAHVKAAQGRARVKGGQEAEVRLPGHPEGSDQVAATSYVLENTGVHAYLGQAGYIKASGYLLTAAEIVTVEARHAGAIGLYLGQAISPSRTSLDVPFTARKVLAMVGKTGFIESPGRRAHTERAAVARSVDWADDLSPSIRARTRSGS